MLDISGGGGAFGTLYVTVLPSQTHILYLYV